MTITEFLLERIEEDEAVAWSQPFANWDGLEVDAIDTGGYLLTISPARALRECEAKWGIVEKHSSCDDVSYGDASTCPELRTLASVYSDHPDYRQEWKL